MIWRTGGDVWLATKAVPHPTHARNPELAGWKAVVVEVVVTLCDRRVLKVRGMRDFRHRFDEDGRLNLDDETRYLRAALESSAIESPKGNPMAEFRQDPTPEEAALFRAHLYRWKHARTGK